MYLKNFFYGIIIGIGFIIPGVSGGVLATLLGIYETIIYKLNNFFKDIKNNILYLSPIIIGILISILLFSKIILYLLDNKKIFISYVFIGLIIGCIPYLIKEIKIKTNKNIAIIPFCISLIFGIILYLIQNNINTYNNTSILIMLFGGILYSIGKIFPGVSGSSLLMLIGIYKYLLNIIANPFNININIIINLIFFMISFILSSIILLKLINFLLNKYFRITYSIIIGFVISSILFIYPNYISYLSIFISLLSFLISYNLTK